MSTFGDFMIAEAVDLRAKLSAECTARQKAESENAELRRQLAALTERQRWVPVGEKMPEVGKWVHLLIDGVVQRIPALWTGKLWVWAEDYDSPPNDIVTHWMPLPAPPTQDAGSEEEGKNK